MKELVYCTGRISGPFRLLHPLEKDQLPVLSGLQRSPSRLNALLSNNERIQVPKMRKASPIG